MLKIHQIFPSLFQMNSRGLEKKVKAVSKPSCRDIYRSNMRFCHEMKPLGSSVTASQLMENWDILEQVQCHATAAFQIPDNQQCFVRAVVVNMRSKIFTASKRSKHLQCKTTSSLSIINFTTAQYFVKQKNILFRQKLDQSVPFFFLLFTREIYLRFLAKLQKNIHIMRHAYLISETRIKKVEKYYLQSILPPQ